VTLKFPAWEWLSFLDDDGEFMRELFAPGGV
jgi:hypothetical protein